MAEEELHKRVRIFLPVKTKIRYAEAYIRGKQGVQSFNLRQFAEKEGVQSSQIRRWAKNINKLRQAYNRGGAKTMTAHTGRPSSFSQGTQLVQWVREMREVGMAVSLNMATIRASQIQPNFRHKSMRARYLVVRRLLRASGIVIRQKTHESQVAPAVKREEAKTFVEGIRPSVNQANRHPDFVGNMDQTPVFFSMTPNTTLETQGSRSVNVRSSSGSTIRLSLAVFVTASGNVEKPLFVFKGKRGGRIETREFRNGDYPDNIVLRVQEKAWMSEEVCLDWVETVVKPWAERAPSGIVPLLLLDQYKCHILGSVTTAIQDCGVEIEYIPSGCTSLCQPVDVGVNKPLKNKIRTKWEEYMLTEGLQQQTTRPPSRKMMAKWCVDSLGELDKNLVRNSWRHGDYSYFPEETIVEENLEDLDDAMDELCLADEMTEEEDISTMDEEQI